MSDYNLDKEIEEGLARAEMMIKKRRNARVIWAFSGLFLITIILGVIFFVWNSNQKSTVDNTDYVAVDNTDYENDGTESGVIVDQKSVLNTTKSNYYSSPTLPITLENIPEIELLNRLGKGRINDFSWSPDGDFFAVASSYAVYLYDVATWTEIQLETNRLMNVVEFSLDSKYLASGASDGTLYVWNLPDLELLSFADAHLDSIDAMSFSNDNRTLVTGSTSELFVWDVPTAKKTNSYPVENGVEKLSFSPSGNHLAVGQAYDDTVEIIEMSSGFFTGYLDTETPYNTSIASIVWDGDEKFIFVSYSDGDSRLWDIQNYSMKRLYEGLDSISLMYDNSIIGQSGDRSLYYVTDANGVDMWDEQIQVLPYHFDWIRQIKQQPVVNGVLAVGLSDGIMFFRGDEWQRTSVLNYSTAVQAAILNSQNELGVGYSLGTPYVNYWDVEKGYQFGNTNLSDVYGVYNMSIAPTFQHIVTDSWGSLYLFDGLGQKMQTFDVGSSSVLDLRLSSDEKYLGAAVESSALFWRVDNGSGVVMSFVEDDWVRTVNFSNNNRLASIGTDGGKVKIIDISSKGIFLELEIPDSWIDKIIFSPDDKNVVVGSREKIYVYSIDGELLATLQQAGWRVGDLVFSNDGKILASVSNGNVNLWNTINWELETTLFLNSHTLQHLFFLKDDKALVGVSWDGLIYTWGIPETNVVYEPDSDLLAYYPLSENLGDITGNFSPIDISDSPGSSFDTSLYCNGVYENSGQPNYCKIFTPILPSLQFNNFSVQVDFLIDDLPDENSPIFVLGEWTRWMGYLIYQDGTVGLLHNNHETINCSSAVLIGEWNTATLAFNGKQANLYLNGELVCSQAVEFSDYPGVGAEKQILLTNYSNGTVFKGYLRNLFIYSKVIVPGE